MKEKLQEIIEKTSDIRGGMDSSAADDLALVIRTRAKEVLELLMNRTREK